MTSSSAQTAYPNIGPRGRKRRGRGAWVWLGGALLFVAYLVNRNAPPTWYALSAIPFLMAALGFFQARRQTCVFLAAAGRVDMDGGAQRVADPAALALMRRQAAGVWMRAILTAAIVTGLVLLFALYRG